MDELGLGGQATRPYADRIPAPRPVPTTRQRLTDARRCHTPEQHRHDDGQDADDRSKDRAIRELEAELEQLGRDYAEANNELAFAWAAINTDRRSGPHSIAEHITRMADDLDSTEQVARFREGVINLHAAELGAAGEVIAVVRDAHERIERALARYDTTPEVTPVEPDDALREALAEDHAVDALDNDDEEAEAPLGSVSPHAQELLHAAAENLLQHIDTIQAHWITLLPRDLGETLLARAAALSEAMKSGRSTEDPVGAEQVLRDRIEHAILARLADTWPALNDNTANNWLDQVAAVAAVAAVNELRQG
ncbi:hypothetical protein AB0C44_07965 [Micromonospora taraxaci]|uniref:hypothetical protein n=1 Tax=Micromonospora taraxaci TaxID=1316803 RepID=UPI0033E64B52